MIPGRVLLFASEMERLATAGSSDWQLRLSYTTRHNQWRDSVGRLRMAYLYVFALLGYNFILRPELNPIRKQFEHPDESVCVPKIMKHTGKSSAGDGISFVYGPAHLRSVLVRLGLNLFFFPGFAEADSFWDRLAGAAPSDDDVTFFRAAR